MTDCPICVEPYNRSTRVPISCVKCDFVCCKICFKRFISDKSVNLSCMSCRTQFDRTSLFTRLGNAFMKTAYKSIREDVLFEEEKTFFPATLQVIEREIEIEKIRKEERDLGAKYEKLKKERTVPLIKFRYSDEVMEVCKAIDMYKQLTNDIEIIDEQLEEEKRALNSMLDSMSKTKAAPKTYIRSCIKYGCQGMLSINNKTSEGYHICAICDTVSCDKCQMCVMGPHTCDPDILKTISFMSCTSKPCPQCGIPIFKISGCNQMFCTSCHVSFDWVSLRINKGAIHNPHHVQWLRETQNRPRELQDVACAREPTLAMALRIDKKFKLCMQKSNLTFESESQYLLDMIVASIHHHNESIRNLGRNQNRHRMNESLRISLLKGLISEDDFKKRIQVIDKASSKRNDLLHIVMLYRDAMSDILSPFLVDDTKSLGEWLSMIREVRALEKYCNDCFHTVSLTYAMTRIYEINGPNNVLR